MATSKLKINYLPELSALMFGRVKPSMVSVNLTERCNQGCIYCEIGKKHTFKNEDILSKDDIFWIIDQMAINRITRLSMCGGEPFLFHGIIDVVGYAWENNIRCNITTTGMTVYKLNERDLKILKDCETVINISIDSFQNSIRQVLYQPIIYYSNYPDKPVIDKKSLLNVSVENLDILMEQLNKIYRFERKHKISTNLYRILPWISYYIKGSAGLDGKWFFHDVLKKFYCREVFAVIDISYDGGIQPCGLSLAKLNIRENRNIGLLDLWAEATIELRDNLSNYRYPQYCNGCCHKFSRNMLASVMRFPISNRITLIKILTLIISRMLSRIYKNLLIKH